MLALAESSFLRMAGRCSDIVSAVINLFPYKLACDVEVNLVCASWDHSRDKRNKNESDAKTSMHGS